VDIQIPFNWKVFAFTAGLTISTGIIFGVAPAWAATKTAIGTSLKQGSRTASRGRSTWSGKLIVAFQITVSTLLVIAAGLFLRSLVHLDSINPGFRTDHLVLFAITPPDQKNAPLKGAALHASLTDAFRNVPGVQGVTLADVPLVAGFMSNEAFHIEGEEGKAPVGDGTDHDPDFDLVGTDFFSVMGIRLLAGRTFNAQDTATSPRVALINQAMAHKYFPNENPIGKRFSPNEAGTPDRKWTQIIGICADTRFASLRADPPPMHFDLYLQQDDVGGMTYIVRTRMKSEAIVPSLRAAVQRVDANLPMLDIRTQQEQIDATTQQERMFASLTAGFGVLALTLACVGIYGIMAYTVSQRTNEIGIRLALGAERGQVRGLVLREAAWLAIFGVVAGLAVALALGRLVKSMLYGLQPTDPPSLAAAASLLLAVALLASWMPALRASRVDPMVALRHE
jgi:predicted permease